MITLKSVHATSGCVSAARKHLPQPHPWGREHDQRRRNREQQYVLRHMRGEERVRERHDKRRDQRDDAESERDPPPRHPSSS